MFSRICLYRKITVAELLLTMIFLACTGTAIAQQAKEKERLQRTKQQLEKEIRQTNDLLDNTRQSKQASLSKLKLLNRQIRNRESLIRTISEEVSSVQATITADSIMIVRLTARLAELKADYARMISLAWRTMNGKSMLMFVFSAHDFNQAWLRMKYYQQYTAYRRTQAARIQGTRLAIQSHRNAMEQTRAEKTGLVSQKVAERQKLNAEKQDKDKTVKELSAREKQLLASLKAKQQDARQLEQAIEKLIAEEIRASEERARKAEAKGTKSSPGVKKADKKPEINYTPRELELSSGFASNRGRLPWPCDKGLISGSFGEHPHPALAHVMVKSNGVDILTDQGAPVRAVFGGKVSRVMSFQSMNNVVIIRHGEYLTVYSNLGEVSVSNGQEVTLRQVIGKVKSNPGEERSELHFEIWRGKVLQDPEEWLSRTN